MRVLIYTAIGKSLLVKAIACKESVCKTGSWYLPKLEQIGYLDQHYANLIPDLPVIAHIKRIRPDWTEIEARRHLNDFLFRSNQEVMQLTCSLSGGEKARLSLSIIAAKTPRLLLLDEVTNNLDLETKEHVIQVLKLYPGSIIVISHEKDFLEAIAVDKYLNIIDGRLVYD